MKKILNVGGKEIVFESNGLTGLIYNQAFKTDYFGDLIKAGKSMAGFSGDFNAIKYEDIEKLDSTIIIKLGWACARTANKEIKPMFEWMEENPEFNPFTHGMEVMQLIQASMDSKKK